MDGPKLKSPLLDIRGRIGAGAAPMAVDDAVVTPGPDQAGAPANSLLESSHVIFCDSDQEIREGFAIALRLMGLGRSE
jgi:hypothetical protein